MAERENKKYLVEGQILYEYGLPAGRLKVKLYRLDFGDGDRPVSRLL